MNTDAKIKRLQLINFSTFEAIDMAFSEGVNPILDEFLSYAEEEEVAYNE